MFECHFRVLNVEKHWMTPGVITNIHQLRIVTLKRTHEFISEIQALIDNDSSKLIRSIVRDVGVSEFLISYTRQSMFHIQDKK